MPPHSWGGAFENGASLALDTSGNVYVTGRTEASDFPTTAGAYDTSWNGGSSDAFISKLDGELTSLLASIFLGGDAGEFCSSIALDTSGNVYALGTTSSSNFPTTAGAYDPSLNGNSNGFISKLDGGLTSLLASTFLGGVSNDYSESIALDTSGNVYVTGATNSSGFPTTAGAYDTSRNGGDDVFISKLDGNLSAEETAITLAYFHAKAGKGGRVTLTWETVTEVGNAGFNLYRARVKDGCYKKINTTLIPAQGNATSGATYRYIDKPRKGTYYYKLEDVDYYGVSTMHCPVKVRIVSDNTATKRRKRK